MFCLLVDGKRNPGVRDNAHEARGDPTVECRSALFSDDTPQQLRYAHADEIKTKSKIQAAKDFIETAAECAQKRLQHRGRGERSPNVK